MIDVPGSAPIGTRWSRLGLIRAAGLAFVCFITVAAAAPSAAAGNEGGIGGFVGLKVPAEDQIAPASASIAVPKRPKRVLEVCPVDRPRRYIDDFGHARWGHRHQGNDIMAPHGTPIRAPFDGRAKKSVSSAGGLGAYVYGKRGFVFNSHLSRFGKLGKVKAGDVIGYVGNTGNARGGSPHDHFEWHPRGGAAVSPFRFLNQACRRAPTRAKPAPDPALIPPSVA
jgi:peptidoglycan LD-endopeptidase LytH